MDQGYLLMRRTRHAQLAALTLLVLGVASLAIARVYQRSPAVSSVDGLAHTLGAYRAYDSEVRINEGAGHVTVLSARGGLDHVVRQIRRSLRLDVDSLRIGDMSARARLERGGHVIRIMILQPRIDVDCLVIILDQSRSDFMASSSAPRAHMLKQVPSYAGSRPTLYMKDQRTSLSLESSVTPAEPTTVHDSLRAALESDGWRPAIQGTESEIHTAGLQIYHRGIDICAVFVQRDRRDAESTITILHKPPAGVMSE